MDETVLFLHVPKTAGTTLYRILERNYPQDKTYVVSNINATGTVDDFQSLPTAQRFGYELVMGHYGHGIHAHVRQPYAYFTVLREPIDRVLSYFHFIREHPEHYLYDRIKIGDMSLEEVLDARFSFAFDNFQTRMIAGVWANVPYGECDEALLAQAKANLRDMAVVGTTERFDETLLLLQRRFDWGNVDYIRHNVTKNRPKAATISPTLREKILTSNQIDAQLYAYANVLLDERLAVMNEDLSAELNNLRRRNRLLKPARQLYWQLRRYSVRTWLKQLTGRSSR